MPSTTKGKHVISLNTTAAEHTSSPTQTTILEDWEADFSPQAEHQDRLGANSNSESVVDVGQDDTKRPERKSSVFNWLKRSRSEDGSRRSSLNRILITKAIAKEFDTDEDGMLGETSAHCLMSYSYAHAQLSLPLYIIPPTIQWIVTYSHDYTTGRLADKFL